jgi:aminopeptidase-like protein
VSDVLLDGPADSGETLHGWASDLFPLNRSLTGPGVRQTLAYLAELMPGLTVHEVPSGTQAFDWQVPDEWTLRRAYLADETGQVLIDTDVRNLHVVGYSEPVDLVLTREELEPHLHAIPDLPDAIPYVTSYYRRTWGMCLSQRQLDALGQGPFHVVIDADLGPGNLTYGELILPGTTTDEVLLSTYVCHPSMANNELSGPVVAVALARWLAAQPDRRMSYRIVFVPETIGSLTYLSRNLSELKANVRAGWVLTCIGDERAYSYVPSRNGGTLADRVSVRVVEELGLPCDVYSFLDRGSDERQYCAPGIELPVASLMRSKYGTFPEYHTSLDDLSFVTPRGLQGGLDMMKHAIRLVEANRTWHGTTLGEPQMGRRGLYPTTSTRASRGAVSEMMNVLAYSDGTNDVLAVAGICGLSTLRVAELSEILHGAGLLEPVA